MSTVDVFSYVQPPGNDQVDSAQFQVGGAASGFSSGQSPPILLRAGMMRNPSFDRPDGAIGKPGHGAQPGRAEERP